MALCWSPLGPASVIQLHGGQAPHHDVAPASVALDAFQSLDVLSHLAPLCARVVEVCWRARNEALSCWLKIKEAAMMVAQVGSLLPHFGSNTQLSTVQGSPSRSRSCNWQPHPLSA